MPRPQKPSRPQRPQRPQRPPRPGRPDPNKGVDPVPQMPGIISGSQGQRGDFTFNPSNAYKVATPDLILFDQDAVPIEQMTNAIFEDIGGHELISISRNDIVNGQKVIYQPISNISKISTQYNSDTMIPIAGSSPQQFRNYPIIFENYVPETGTGPNGEIVYIDPDTLNLIINVANLASNEQVEVQILSRGEVFDDTIY